MGINAYIGYVGAFGAVAQLVAHLHGMQGVRGSSPLSSTLRVVTSVHQSGTSREPT